MRSHGYLAALLLVASCARADRDRTAPAAEAPVGEGRGPAASRAPGAGAASRPARPHSGWRGDCFEATGALASEERAVAGFDSVKIAGSVDVTLRQSATREVRVEAASDLLSRIATEVRGSTLVIHTESGCHTSKLATRVHVAAPVLSAVTLAGSGNVRSEGRLEGRELSVRIAGSGNAKLDLAFGRLELDVDGSGNAKLSGHADVQRIRISGSGNVEADELSGKRCMVAVRGSGNARVHASESLEAVISGSGDIRYTGAPGNLRRVVHGSGEIAPLR